MERMMRWRAVPIRAGRVHRRNTGGRRLRAAAVAGAMVAVAMPALSADGAVGGGRSIEVFTGTDMIGLSGYPPNSKVRVEVVRHGFVVGFATKRTDSLGGVVMNHVGGAAGDCFDSRTSPDVEPTDTIRTTILKPGGARDTSVVRGVWIDDMQFDDTTITVSGHVAVDGPGAVDPAVDGLELRIDKDTDWSGTDGSDLREVVADVQSDGTWTHEITATAADVREAELEGETSLQWSDGTAEPPSELTIAEFGEQEPLLGCPPPASGPTAPLLLGAHDSADRGDHVTNRATGLTFSGLVDTSVEGAGQGETVTLQVDGTPADEVTADGNGVYTFTGVNLTARATPHTVRVITSEGNERRLVTVDATKPGVRMRSFRPSPLHLDGAQQLRAVYRIGEGATLQARVEHVKPTFTARAFARRTQAAAGTAAFVWNAQDPSGSDVRPGRYRMVLRVTDKAGNVTVQSNAFRVAR
jgi:hypothetical protein